MRDDLPDDRQRMVVVEREMVGDAGAPCMDVGAAELLRRDDLAGRRLHQRRAGEEDRPLPLHDDRLVRHGGHIGAARRARAHHAGDLRNPRGRHPCLVEEDAAEMIAVGKHLRLVRQVRAAGIDEIDAGKPVFLRDLLRPKVLLHGHRIIGAAFDRRIVADDHDQPPRDPPDAGDDAGAADLLAIHAVRGKRREFEERCAGIEKLRHTLAGQELSARHMPFARPRRPAERRLLAPLAILADEVGPRSGIVGADRGIEPFSLQDCHRPL